MYVDVYCAGGIVSKVGVRVGKANFSLVSAISMQNRADAELEVSDSARKGQLKATFTTKTRSYTKKILCMMNDQFVGHSRRYKPVR
jgi:hypothetical protein